jgi:hypothetical protein
MVTITILCVVYLLIKLEAQWAEPVSLTFHSALRKQSPPRKPLGQINRNMAGSIYGMSSMKNAHFISVNKYGHHRQFLFLIGQYLKNHLLWNCLAISEEKIKMWKVNRWQTTNDGCQKPTLPLAQWAKKNIKMWIPTCNV